MSAPEFQDMRGISGTAVATKVCYLVANPRKRSLLLFLQGLSLEPGGLMENVIRPLLRSHASRLGSPTMHRVGIGGRAYKPEIAAEIDTELSDNRTQANRMWKDFYSNEAEGRRKFETSPAALVERCRQLAMEHLETFLVELCINPYVPLLAPGDTLTGKREQMDYYDSKTAQLNYFKDIHSALFEFQAAHSARIAARFVKTEVATIVFDALNKACRRSKIFCIEGREGVGKSEAAKTFCAMFPGTARYVDLKGMSSKKEVFRAINKALGLSATYTRKQGDLKARAEDFLKETKVLLVLDEASQLLPAGKRVYVQPEMLNWLYTLTNSGSSLALITTSQFWERVRGMEKQIAWNFGQVERRVIFCKLPEQPTRADLDGIARMLLEGSTAATIKLLVGFAGTVRHSLTAMADVVADARDHARERGREIIAIADLEQAIQDLTPTYEARSEAFHMESSTRRRARNADFNAPFNGPEMRIPIALSDEVLPEVMESSSSRFAGHLQET